MEDNRRTKIPRVGLVVESSRTYGRGILRGIARYARAHGPWSFFTVERELHSGVPDWLLSWKGDGIIARIEDRRMASKLVKLGCPVVDVLGQARIPNIPAFDTDAQAVAEMAADFYLRAGFNHFAYSGYKGIPFSDRRGAAFATYLGRRGRKVALAPSNLEARGAGDIQSVEQRGMAAETQIARWLEKQPRPLAVFACNDILAQQVLNACRENGIRVPEEVAVMGVDNDDVLCSLCEPPLTSVEPDTERLGYEAAALLDKAMRGGRIANRTILIPPLRLVERSSTDVVAIADPIVAQSFRFIRNELGSGIAVKDVLNYVKRSRTDLEQRFRRSLGRSVAKVLLESRLDRVRLLLRETDLTLGKIADQAGLTGSTHLCHLFRRRYGQTPSEYRAGPSVR